MSGRSGVLLAILILTSSPILAKGGGSHGYRSYSSHSSYSHSSSYSSRPSHSKSVSGSHRSTYSTVAPRDSHGRIKRSESEKRAFEGETGHPNGWKGHVVDHIVPLKRGGSDTPRNMQWQTTQEAKAKDKVE